jgi:hypothetical protein
MISLMNDYGKYHSNSFLYLREVTYAAADREHCGFDVF